MSKNPKTTAYVRVTAGQKSKGHTAGQKIDYILRQGAFKHKDGLVASGAGNLPNGFDNHRQYWQMTDEHERANSVAFREFLIDLPDHLPMSEVLELAEEAAEEISRNPENRALLAYQYAVHADPKTGYGRHLHLVISEREQDGVEREPELFFKRQNKKEPSQGGAPKLANNVSALKNRTNMVKDYVANVINATLEDFNMLMRVDFNINKKDGKQAQVKLSPKDWKTLQAYKLDDKVTINKAIKRFIEIDNYNNAINDLIAERAALDAEIAALERLPEPKPQPVPQVPEQPKPTPQQAPSAPKPQPIPQPQPVANPEPDPLPVPTLDDGLTEFEQQEADAISNTARELAKMEAEYAQEDAEAEAAKARTASPSATKRNNDPTL
ncbi:MAG: hypothetical protein GX029_14245 [Pseudomonadaceae bacterium]|nr:hypothetical protein [Pseudomonadaceae bacterium]